jgi:aminopeptidase YwaD
MGIEVIEYLAGEIGIRFSGTSAEERGVQYIQDQFQRLGLETRLDRFQFLGWELEGEPILRLAGPVDETLPCWAFVYSPSTPPNGLALPVQRVGKAAVLRGIDADCYALVDPESGQQRAHIIVRLDGPACAMPLSDPTLAIPTVMIGGDVATSFSRTMAEHPGLIARLTLASKLKPHATSCNVVATLPGRDGDKTVLVTSHHDTEYNCPGAVDNASGVQAVLSLAQRLKGESPATTVQFVVFGCEEYMLLGAKHYAGMLRDSGTLAHVDAIVNLDMLACNSPNWINVTQDAKEFKVRVARVFERFDLFRRYGDIRWELPPWPTSDHAPFTEAGIPTLFVSYEGQRYPHLHLPTDTIDKVDTELLDLSINFVHCILQDLCHTA